MLFNCIWLNTLALLWLKRFILPQHVKPLPSGSASFTPFATPVGSAEPFQVWPLNSLFVLGLQSYTVSLAFQQCPAELVCDLCRATIQVEILGRLGEVSLWQWISLLGRSSLYLSLCSCWFFRSYLERWKREVGTGKCGWTTTATNSVFCNCKDHKYLCLSCPLLLISSDDKRGKNVGRGITKGESKATKNRKCPEGPSMQMIGLYRFISAICQISCWETWACPL